MVGRNHPNALYFRPVVEVVVALDHFPIHKIALWLYTARIRDQRTAGNPRHYEEGTGEATR
jgi:hypothetical protein